MDTRTDGRKPMNGWYEYEEPYLFNNGSTRRFYRNDELNQTIWIQERFGLFKKGPLACIDYRCPRTGLMYLLPETVDGCDYPDDVLMIEKLKDIPEDPELIGLLGGGRKLKDILFDMYGGAVVFTKVEDKGQAFEIAELMVKRQQGGSYGRVS